MSTDAVEIIETNGQRSRSLFTRPSLRGDDDDDERKKERRNEEKRIVAK